MQPEPRRGTIPVGGATTEHYHRTTEELCIVGAGTGRLVINSEERVSGQGDCALVAPARAPQAVQRRQPAAALVYTCAPAYSDRDACLTE